METNNENGARTTVSSIKRSSSLSTRRKSFAKLKSRTSLEKPFRKLSFQIKTNIDKFSVPLKDLITRTEGSSDQSEPQSPSDVNRSRGFMNAFQHNARTSHTRRRVILNVGGVKHEGGFI